MANVDNPFGFRPIRRAGASYNSGGGNVYAVPTTVAVQIAPGDLVTVDGEADLNGIPTVGPSGADEALTGVMLGIANSPSPGLDGSGAVTFDSTLNTVAASPDIQYILVEDDPQVTYVGQASTALTVSDISNNALVVAAVPTQDGKSAYEIGATDPGDATAPLKILRLQQIEGNEVGILGVFEVLINNSTQSNNTAGV